MSRSRLIKLFLLTVVFFLPVKFASAATLTFGTGTWQVAPVFSVAIDNPSVRNDLDLAKLAKNAVLGTVSQTTDKLYDAQTADQINLIATAIDQQAQDAKLVINGKYATEFNPGQAGQGLDVYDLREMLIADQSQITLPVITSSPTNKLSDTNNLGINELVATGSSDFSRSPKNRIHNIDVGAAIYNNLIIDQGEEFSFNKYLGDVDAANDFLPELVIKATGVAPEFGGGLCQVSTTMFRAAMNAGLPITDRRNHSFAVSYYAPQGTDATIYPGSADLKFVNNLSSPILIRTRIEGNKLYFDFYGTKDQRTVTFDGPTQYDRKPDGSLKASWTRHVTLNGQTTDQTFLSVYQPPANFKEILAPSTPNPQAIPTTNTTKPVTQ